MPCTPVRMISGQRAMSRSSRPSHRLVAVASVYAAPMASASAPGFSRNAARPLPRATATGPTKTTTSGADLQSRLRAAFQIKLDWPESNVPPSTVHAGWRNATPSISERKPAAATTLAIPQIPRTGSARFCSQANSRTAPAHARAKLCMTMSVGRSSAMRQIPAPWLGFGKRSFGGAAGRCNARATALRRLQRSDIALRRE